MTIIAYHRPQTLDEALSLLAQPHAVPLGGGVALARAGVQRDDFSVVDLQALNLDRIEAQGNTLRLGAMATLQAVLETGGIPAALQAAIRCETTFNLRQQATVAGALVACDGRSGFAAALLALDGELSVSSEQSAESGEQGTDKTEPLTQASRSPLAAHHVIRLGEFLPLRQLPGKLITEIIIPTHVQLAFEKISRTPAGWPLVCVALARWPSGRLRLALGGFGGAPLLALDGLETAANAETALETAARGAYAHAGDDWASAEYRSEMAALLAKRCFHTLEAQS